MATITGVALALTFLMFIVVATCPGNAAVAQAAPAAGAATSESPGILGYYRYPALRDTVLVFVAEGDLWTVSATGGLARRLTTHPGLEQRPAISPDGYWLAFSATYEGPTEVYVMPLAGGIPTRLTWEGDALVVGWTPDGRVLYSTSRYSTLPEMQLAMVAPPERPVGNGRPGVAAPPVRPTPPALIPLAQAADGVFSPDGRTLIFTRLPHQGSHTKRYMGGMAQQLWSWSVPEAGPTVALGAYGRNVLAALEGAEPLVVGGATVVAASLRVEVGQPGARPAAARPQATPDPVVVTEETTRRGGLASAPVTEARPLTANYPGTSKQPMWWQGRVYFLTDRLTAEQPADPRQAKAGVMNIWSMAPDGSGLRRHTSHEDYDAQSPSLDPVRGRIAYQHGADIRVLDLRTGEDRVLDIRLASDFEQLRERWIEKPLEWATSVHLSPTGDRIALTARGQVFVAPVKSGRLVEATRKKGVRYRDARFMPDGRNLLTLSDESGEVELWTVPANGIGAAAQLTDDGKVLRTSAVPSPDGRWIAHTDHDRRLWVYDARTRRSKQIDHGAHGGHDDLAWSPDSRWLAYTERAASSFQQIWLYDTRTGEARAITSERYDSYAPTWSPDGNWLWFLSDRDLEPVGASVWASRYPEPAFPNQTRIYQLALRPGLRSPFAEPDEVHAARAQDAGGSGARADGKPDAAPAVQIELAGLEGRLTVVPVPRGNYWALSTDGKRLYFLDRDWLSGKQNLKAVEIRGEDVKAETVVEDVRGYQLSADGKKLLVRKGEALYVFDAGSKAPKLEDARVDLSAWKFTVDAREELRQMFVEAWRLERDYFYDPGMHGLDWFAVGKKYEPLAERMTDRHELSDALAQMVGELSALHIFVRGGDARQGKEQIEPASLGAVLERDEARGGYVVAHIYRGDPDLPDELAPLAQPGVDVQEGDVIEMIDGVPLLSVPDPAVLLRDRAGKQTLLRVRSRAGGAARDVVVRPITQRREADLRYDEWEYTRRLATEKLSGGRIGYIHLRAMGNDNITEFTRDFYPVAHKDALIVDVRHNRGGNIDSWVLEKLMRRVWFWWKDRTGEPYPNMQYAPRGPMIILVDERTSSDGEAVAEGFRRLGLGKVLGDRTWGGEIWLTSSNFLVDRGIATAAEFGVYGPEGEWLIEGWGVEPDVVVDNPPAATFAGADAQLEAAIAELLRELEKKPVVVPAPPPYRR